MNKDKMPGAHRREDRIKKLVRRPRSPGSYAAIVGPEKAREWAEDKRRTDEEIARRRFADPAVRAYVAGWGSFLRENRPFS